MKRESDKAAAKWQVPIVILATLAGVTWWLVWEKKEERRVCVLNQRNVQQAVRAWTGLCDIHDGTPLPPLSGKGGGTYSRPLFGPDSWWMKEVPVCPSGGVYSWRQPTVTMEAGVVYLECSCKDHQPTGTSGW